MNITKLLQLAGVPAELHAEALACFAQAKLDHPSHLRKHWIRLTKAGKIADMLGWETNRLIEVRPDLLDLDIAPVLNVTAHGDNGPWVETPEGGRPNPDAWLNKNPESDEYKQAVASNYWCPGEHPRTCKSHKAQYRRNGGEGQAWRFGKSIDPSLPLQEWTANGITVLKCASVWQAYGTLRILGPLRWKFDVGYEIGNAFAKLAGRWVQSWYPLPGYELRACVCWVVYPTIFKS